MATNPFNLATPLPVGTPFLANNGNPNTVYNTEATPFQNTPIRGTGSPPLITTGAATAALPPAWTPANPPAALPSMPTNSAYSNPATQFWQDYAGVNRPTFNLADSGAWGTNPFAPPPAAPPVTTPPVTNPTDTTGGGGITGPNQGGRENENGGTVRPPVGGIYMGGWTGDGVANFVDEDGNVVRGNNLESITNGLRDMVTDMRDGLGFNGRDGTFDANQFADALTEIFLPGDLYNANVGRWNTLNIATSLLNTFVPGLGNLGQTLIDMLPEGNPIRLWMQRRIVQNNVDEAQDNDNYMNAPQGGGGGGDGEGRGNIGGGRTSRPIGTSWGGGYSGSGNVVVHKPDQLPA